VKLLLPFFICTLSGWQQAKVVAAFARRGGCTIEKCSGSFEGADGVVGNTGEAHQ
jgi:hypothetical protein